jgi:hypothetical protein
MLIFGGEDTAGVLLNDLWLYQVGAPFTITPTPGITLTPSITMTLSSTPTPTLTLTPTLTPTATPNPCLASLGVTVAPDGAGRLQVTLGAHSGSLARVPLVADAHVLNPNALFDVPGGPTGAMTLNGQPSTPAFGFAVRQQTPGQAVTVPLLITDGCGGQWSTLVGGGPSVFSGPAGVPNRWR